MLGSVLKIGSSASADHNSKESVQLAEPKPTAHFEWRAFVLRRGRKGWKFKKDEGWKPWFRSAIKRIFEHLDAEEEVRPDPEKKKKRRSFEALCIHSIRRSAMLSALDT